MLKALTTAAIALWIFSSTLFAHPFLGSSNTSPTIAFVGDSLTLGANGTHPYPYYISLPTWNSIVFRSFNLGIQGRTAQTMLALSNDNINPLFAYNAGSNILIIWAGTNDLAAGTSPEQTFAYLKQLCLAMRRVGWKVIVVTTISRTGLDIQKDTLNALTQAKWSIFADALADVAANANLGADGACNNPIYFVSDHVHLTDAGYELVASIVGPVITTLVAAE